MAAVFLEGRRAAWREQLPDMGATPGMARDRLLAHPLDGRAYRVLGLEAERAGDRDAGRRLMHIAARRTPRDRVARAWLADDGIARDDPGTAIAHVDALLRMDALLRAAFAPRLAMLSSERPALRARLLEVLRSGAPWRREVVLAWLGGGATLAEVRTLMGGLGPPTREERDAWAARLAAAGAWREARVAAGEGTTLMDGGFDRPGTGPFDWRLQPGEGRRVERVLTDDRRIALRVELDGARVQAAPVEQRLALAAGRYRVTVTARTEGLDSGDGIAWTITCEDGRAVGATLPMAASPAWRRVAADAMVPADCPTQWLRLHVPQGADRAPRGVAWVDGASVARVGAATEGGREAVGVAEAPAASPEAHALFADRARSFQALVPSRRMPDAPLGP